MVTALDDISFRVSQRETVAVMGPSGSGKTTLLNLIGGLDHPTHGSVATLGLRLNDLSERELTAFRAHLIGLVFQDPHLLPGLSALENVVAARIPWQARRELERGARGLLNAVGLRERMDFPPARLSGGERQRVGIARSLLGKPRLLLADEPTGNLDAGTTLDVLDLLAQLHADLGLTMVVVTHDATVASRADRVVRLAGGHVVG
jgi:putative ABC transport system ATP-binding protein